MIQMKSLATFLATCATLALLPPSALAGGMEYPGNGARATARGGAFAARADDLSALAHNPGGIAKLKGNHFFYSHTLDWLNLSYTRQQKNFAPTEKDATFGDPFETVSNEEKLFPLGVMIGASSDFGSENWTFAAGVYGPSAHGKLKFPVEGGQRYMLTEMESLLVYYTLAAAYSDGDNYGIGATFQWVDMPLTKMSLVVDGTSGDTLSPYYSQPDVLSTLDLKDRMSFTGGLGAWWKMTPKWEIAASVRAPVTIESKGDITLRNIPGHTDFPQENLDLTNSSAAMDIPLPLIARGGLRYISYEGGEESFDVELNVVYEGWHVMDQYALDLEGQVNLYAATEVPDVTIGKKWRDTVSVRLGGTSKVGDGLAVSWGGYVENGAVPENYAHLDFPSFNRLGLGGGFHWEVGDITLNVAYNHIFQQDQNVDEDYAKVFQERPVAPCDPSSSEASCGGQPGLSGIPANAGTYTSSLDVLSLSAQAKF